MKLRVASEMVFVWHQAVYALTDVSIKLWLNCIKMYNSGLELNPDIMTNVNQN